MIEFINRVRKRLNLRVILDAFLISLIIVGSVVVLLGMVFIIQGHAVALWVYSVSGMLFVSCLCIYYFWKKQNNHKAAKYADKFFGLKDSVVSAIEFSDSKRENKYKKLQYAQTASRVDKLDTKLISLSVPRKLAVLAGISVMAALSMSLIPPSQEVLEKQKKEREMSQRTAEIQKKFEDEVEKLILELEDDEKALMTPSEIRKWVKEMKPTAKEREAMLNIARIRQKIQKKIAGLESRKNEALLKTAGLKLKTSPSSKAQSTGKAMEEKDFDKIKKALEEFKIRKDKELAANKDIKDLLDKLKRKPDELSEEEKKNLLEELKKKFGEIRELTKKLAEAAGELNMGQEAEEVPEDMDFAELPEDFPMDRLMELLDLRALGGQQLMDQRLFEMMDGELMDEDELRELLEMLENMDEGMEQMQEMMDEMGARRMLRQKLEALKQAMGRAKGFAQGKSQNLLFNIPQKGGKKPGRGTNSARRKEKDEDVNNKNYTKLKGQQGTGPVNKKVEAATSGTGVSNRKGNVKARNYEHQLSSYMNRDDVPEDMKQAMKQYYKDIHALQEVEPKK